MLKARKLNDISMFHTKSWDAHTKFIRVHFTKCLIYGVPRRVFWREKHWWEGKCCYYEDIHSVQKNHLIAPQCKRFIPRFFVQIN